MTWAAKFVSGEKVKHQGKDAEVMSTARVVATGEMLCWIKMGNQELRVKEEALEKLEGPKGTV